jgi:predicted transcriptional regulator
MPRRPLFSRSGPPLTSSTFYLLLAVSSDQRDERGILDSIAMSSAGRVRMTPATLAIRIRRLTDAGLVARHGDSYRLTHEGRLQLADELERMERTVRLARGGRAGRS